MFRKNLGIDIGATQISICSAEDGLLLKEPAVAAVDVDTGEVCEAGNAALRAVEARPDRYCKVEPLWDDLLGNARVLSAMLRIFMRRAVGRTVLRPQVMISIPCDLGEVQVNAIEDAALAAGASKAHLLEAPLCAALGAGVDFSAPVARMVMHIGASRTEIAVIFIGEMVTHLTIPSGGNRFDSAIIHYMRDTHNLYIGKKTAEQIKLRIATVKDEKPKKIDVKGRCMETKQRRIVSISSRDMLGAIQEPLAEIMDAFIAVVDQLDDDMRADIAKHGVLLTGGGVITGLDWFINQLFKIRARRAPNAEVAAVEGAALALARL